MASSPARVDEAANFQQGKPSFGEAPYIPAHRFPEPFADAMRRGVAEELLGLGDVRRQVRVTLGHLDGRVAEELCDLEQRYPALHEPGGEGVPQIVDPEVLNLGPRARRLRPVLHEPNALPVPVSEDPV